MIPSDNLLIFNLGNIVNELEEKQIDNLKPIYYKDKEIKETLVLYRKTPWYKLNQLMGVIIVKKDFMLNKITIIFFKDGNERHYELSNKIGNLSLDNFNLQINNFIDQIIAKLNE